MFASFTSKLPWEDCGAPDSSMDDKWVKNEWTTDFCFSITDYKNCSAWREKEKNETGDSKIFYHKGM